MYHVQQTATHPRCSVSYEPAGASPSHLCFLTSQSHVNHYSMNEVRTEDKHTIVSL